MKIFHLNFSGRTIPGNILAVSPGANALQISPGAFATPGSHLLHAYDLLTQVVQPQSPQVAILNPYIEIDRPLEKTLINASESISADGGVIAAADGFPLLYLLPQKHEASRKKYLRFASCSNSEVDIRIARQVFGDSPELVVLPHYRRKHFLLNPFALENSFVHEETCERVSACLDQGHLPEIYAVVPHHAGDVLFAASALQNLSERDETDIRGLVVNTHYASIARTFGIETIAISTPVVRRDVVADSEPANILKEYIRPLDKEIAPLYMRMSFEYSRTNLSLEEHFRYAMQRLPTNRLADPKGKKVLLHLDAGWKTKILSERAQEALVDALRNEGFELSILADRKKIVSGIETRVFSGLDQLRDDIDRADLVVGMDSFPAHFAANCRSKPTIVVFSATKPENSRPPAETGGVALWGPLDCSPCHGSDCCPITGKECTNFPSAEEIAGTARALLSGPLELPGHWLRIPWMPNYTNPFISPYLRRLFVLFHTLDMLLRAFVYHAWKFGMHFAFDMARQFILSFHRRIANNRRMRKIPRQTKSDEEQHGLS